MHHGRSDLPPEVIERIIDAPGVSSDRETLLACSEVGRAWHVRSMANLFRVLEIVYGDAQNSWRWYSSESPTSDGQTKEDAFIRVTPDEFLNQLLKEYAHLVRYVKHLQISSGFGDGDRGDDDNPIPHANLLADPRFRFPDDHLITQLTVTGRAFAIPDPRDVTLQNLLLANFNKLTRLRMSGVHFLHAGCFTRFISTFTTLRLLDLSHCHVHADPGSGTSEVPTFLRPVTVVLRPDAKAFSYIGLTLGWMDMGGAARFGQVLLDASMPSDAHEGSVSTAVLAAPRISRELITVLKLSLVWQRWAAAKDLVAGLPNLRKIQLTIRDGWHITSDTTLARVLSSNDLVPGVGHESFPNSNPVVRPPAYTLEALVVILEAGNPPTTYLSGRPWLDVARALEQPHWADLKSCVLRLRASARIPGVQKRSIRQDLKAVWIGTKLRVCVDDSSEVEDVTGEFEVEDLFVF